MGSGPAINGRSLQEIGGMVRNIVKALDLATEAIANNENIPCGAIDAMSSKLIPTWLYTFFGNRSWKTQAKQFNIHKHLYAKPYERIMRK